VTPFCLTVLMYHYVRDAGDGSDAGCLVPGLPVAEFEAQLDWAARDRTPIAWPELRDHLLVGKPLPPQACLLTFDDGTRDHYLNVAPRLRARGLSGLFFVLARQPGGGLALPHRIHFLLGRLGCDGLRAAVWEALAPLDRERFERAEAHYRAAGRAEVDVLKLVLQRDGSAAAGALLSRLMAERVGDEADIAGEYYLAPGQAAEMRSLGMHFGGHSREHVWFDWVDADVQAGEMRASAEWLGTVEPGPWPFAYPYGGFSPCSAHLLRAEGFAAAFTTVAQVEHADPYRIGRLDGEALSADLAVAGRVALA
jgi:peptidoglycan/xylan/chitin deacetylase (PgdA/CDA1 family)